MELLNRKSKRVRPIMGTYFGISLSSLDDSEDFFNLASVLESECSLFNPRSNIAKFNDLTVGEWLSVSSFFSRLVEQALLVRGLSDAAFEPIIEGTPFSLKFESPCALRKVGPMKLDLNGMAKGAIVDEVARQISARSLSLPAVVNAGGDMRFIGGGPHTAQIRMGPPDRPIERSLKFSGSSIATSSPSLGLSRVDSTTVYRKQAWRGEGFTVTAVAENCALADALTKVGLFANPEIIALCAEQLKASIYVFDSGGSLVECYGDT